MRMPQSSIAAFLHPPELHAHARDVHAIPKQYMFHLDLHELASVRRRRRRATRRTLPVHWFSGTQLQHRGLLCLGLALAIQCINRSGLELPKPTTVVGVRTE